MANQKVKGQFQKGGGKLKLILIIVAAVVLATALSVVGTMFFLSSSGDGSEKGKEDAATKEEPLHVPASYFELEEPLIVSIGEEQRYAQVHLAIVMREHDVSADLEKHLPTLRSRLQRVVRRQEFEALQRKEIKEKLAQTMLETVNGILEQEGAHRVERILFTNFVMQ